MGMSLFEQMVMAAHEGDAKRAEKLLNKGAPVSCMEAALERVMASSSDNRCKLRITPRPDRTNTVTGRWHRILKFIATYFESCGARPARFPPRGTSADLAQSTRAAQCGLGVVVLWANTGRALPHAVCQRSIAPTPR